MTEISRWPVTQAKVLEFVAPVREELDAWAADLEVQVQRSSGVQRHAVFVFFCRFLK